jgi:hypothetical protein
MACCAPSPEEFPRSKDAMSAWKPNSRASFLRANDQRCRSQSRLPADYPRAALSKPNLMSRLRSAP